MIVYKVTLKLYIISSFSDSFPLLLPHYCSMASMALISSLVRKKLKRGPLHIIVEFEMGLNCVFEKCVSFRDHGCYISYNEIR